ncbi:MAG: DUF1214 domain-containing protein, partial [Rhizobiales bacterium]|nr:DUF1214 domain-containing protein [Hyphomicrobiales bacterium]
MRFLLGLLLTLAIATFTGLGATWYATVHGLALGGVTIGAWTAQPKNGTLGIDPYARAMIARSGELPLGSGDGVAFSAGSDDSGQPLDGRCDVTISGVTPQARFWTITAYDRRGNVLANPVGRHGLTSMELFRNEDGSFTITAAPRARPGNW